MVSPLHNPLPGRFNGPDLFGSPLYSHIFWLVLKLAVLVPIVIIIRCIFPRLRMDQMLRLGWYYLTPMAVLNLFIVLALKMWGLA